MKILFICLVLGCATSIHAQPSIVGTWRFDIEASFTGDRAAKVKYDSLPSSSKTRIADSFESRTFSFSGDGSIAIAWSRNGDEKNVAGTYSFDNLAMTVRIAISGRETVFDVLTLTASDLVLADESTKGLFHKLHFKRFEQ